MAHHNPLLGPNLVFVYADGRVLWHVAFDELIRERRLSPEGLELVRSGEVGPSALLPPWMLPANAWADETKMYVPSRYGICVDPSQLDMLPSRAEAVLSGKDRLGGCFEVTTDDARALDDILSDAGLERIVGGGGDTGIVALSFDTSERLTITFQPLLPHGELIPNTPG